MADETVESLVSKLVFEKSHGVYPNEVERAVIVLGGGIAGIEVSLKLASAGVQVYLIERNASIGGKVCKFELVYPAMEDAMSFMAPRMEAVSADPNITLLSLADLERFEGEFGNFQAVIRRRARYVRPDRCNACGECVRVCPVSVFDGFNEKMSLRKAIYLPFQGAVPNSYLIDKGELPHCRNACPVDQDAPGYITLIKLGKYKEAFDLIRLKNPLPSVSAYICPAHCERVCKRSEMDRTVQIKKLKRYVTDWAFDRNMTADSLIAIVPRMEKVAVVGAGPAGLSCAHDIRRKGYQVTVFEESPHAGGLLVSGIPDFVIPHEKVKFDIDQIRNMGVEFKFNTRIGDQVTLKDLKTGYDAVFLATGAQKSTRKGIPGEEAAGCFDALSFLQRFNKGEKPVLGSRVIVIGNGNAAAYCALAASLLGADDVRLLIAGGEENDDMDSEMRERLGKSKISLVLHTDTDKIIAKQGRVSAVECYKLKRDPEISGPDIIYSRIPDSMHRLDADTVLIVSDRRPDLGFTRGTALRIRMTQKNTVHIDPETLATSTPGFFAGGEVTSGPATVMDAIVAGKRAAISIHAYLQNQSVDSIFSARLENRPAAEEELVTDRETGEIPVSDESMKVEHPGPAALESLSESWAMNDAGRCLQCGICVECWECNRVCEEGAIDHNMRDNVNSVSVGHAIVATGYSLFDAIKIPQLRYIKCANVLTGMEFERLCSKNGPTGGRIVLGNNREPQTIGIIHCVGSRNKKYHEYCSQICCMYSLKFASLIQQKTSAQVYQFYIDIRGTGKQLEEFYNNLRNAGVRFIRGQVAEISDYPKHPTEKGKVVICCEDTLAGKVRRIPVDLAIVAPAVEPALESAQTAGLLGIDRDADGFIDVIKDRVPPIFTGKPGVLAVGACREPLNIQHTILQAHAAAAAVLTNGGKTIS